MIWNLMAVDYQAESISTKIQAGEAGKYEVEFNGSSFASGVYFYQLKAGNFIQTKKMMLMK